MSRTSGSGLGSWLSGPGTPESGTYPGERLGLPRSGSGSIARFGRRIAALAVDWVISLGLAALATTLGLISLPVQTTQLIVRFLLGVVSVRPGVLVRGAGLQGGIDAVEVAQIVGPLGVDLGSAGTATTAVGEHPECRDQHHRRQDEEHRAA